MVEAKLINRSYFCVLYICCLNLFLGVFLVQNVFKFCAFKMIVYPPTDMDVQCFFKILYDIGYLFNGSQKMAW